MSDPARAMPGTARTNPPGTSPPDAGASEERRRGALGPGALLFYLAVGVYFGFLLTKSEVISWFRIQEMFRFQGFHMYGILGSAVAVAALSLAVIRRTGLRSVGGEEVGIPPKKLGRRNYRYWVGGLIFGVGWAFLGACPGPIYALIGNGILVYAVALLAALAGTWTYGWLRPRLPHY